MIEIKHTITIKMGDKELVLTKEEALKLRDDLNTIYKTDSYPYPITVPCDDTSPNITWGTPFRYEITS